MGKTNIVANLGYTLRRFGKKVLILDADLGLGNLDVLLGLTPQYKPFSCDSRREEALRNCHHGPPAGCRSCQPRPESRI